MEASASNGSRFEAPVGAEKAECPRMPALGIGREAEVEDGEPRCCSVSRKNDRIVVRESSKCAPGSEVDGCVRSCCCCNRSSVAVSELDVEVEVEVEVDVASLGCSCSKLGAEIEEVDGDGDGESDAGLARARSSAALSDEPGRELPGSPLVAIMVVELGGDGEPITGCASSNGISEKAE